MRAIERRTLLIGFLAGTALAAVGCSSGIPLIGNSGPDGEVKSAAARSEAELIALYDGVLATFPRLGQVVESFRDQHRQHLAAIPGVDQTPAVSIPTIEVASSREAVQLLRRAERDAARGRVGACVASRDPSLCELLARIGSSEAAHAAYLSGVS